MTNEMGYSNNIPVYLAYALFKQPKGAQAMKTRQIEN
jgi:hypothetical protein